MGAVRPGRRNARSDVAGGACGLLRQFLVIDSDHGEALSGLADAGRLIVAFSGSRLVCYATEVRALSSSWICELLESSWAVVAVAGPSPSSVRPTTRAASLAFWLTSWIDALVSCVPVATVCTSEETRSAAADTAPAWLAKGYAEPLLSAEVADSSSRLADRLLALALAAHRAGRAVSSATAAAPASSCHRRPAFR